MGIPAEHLWVWRGPGVTVLVRGFCVPQGGERMKRKGCRERLLLPMDVLQSSVLYVSSLHSRQGCRLSNKSFAISSARCSLAKTSLSAETELTRSAKCFGLHERQGQHDLNCVLMEMDLSSVEKMGCSLDAANMAAGSAQHTGTTMMASGHRGAEA